MYSEHLDAPTLSFFLACTSVALFPGLKLPTYLQDFAWSTVLQSALVLSVFQMDDSALLEVDSLRPMLVAFIFGAVGSFIGGVLGGGFVSRSIEPFAIGSLVASYIGGTANFFETCSFAPRGTNPSIFSSIAAVDIGIMVTYFSFLLWLRRFGGCDEYEGHCEDNKKSAATSSEAGSSWGHQVVVSGAAVAITRLAGVLQQLVGVLGLNVTLSTGFAVALRKFLNRGNEVGSRNEFQSAARGPTTYAMALFYAAIGMSTTVLEVVQAGPQILSAIASILAVHLAFVWGGWKLVARWAGKGARADMDSVIIASNAAVGGSATAAAMASQIGRDDLILPASLCGMLGYALGTSVGRAAVPLITLLRLREG